MLHCLYRANCNPILKIRKKLFKLTFLKIFFHERHHCILLFITCILICDTTMFAQSRFLTPPPDPSLAPSLGVTRSPWANLNYMSTTYLPCEFHRYPFSGSGGDVVLRVLYFYLAPRAPGRGSAPILTNLNPHPAPMPLPKFEVDRPSGSWEEVENVKS